MQGLSDRVEETEMRVGQMEDWAEEATRALLTCLEQQRYLQQKVTDLESRSRRNNVRVFRVGEGEEGDSILHFILNLIKSELTMLRDVDLKIQRAHCSLAPRPPTGTHPRPIIVNF